MRGYFDFIEGKHNTFYHDGQSKNSEAIYVEMNTALPRFELGSLAPKANIKDIFSPVDDKKLNEYFSLRSIEGISNDWLIKTKNILVKYLNYLGWKISKKKTL